MTKTNNRSGKRVISLLLLTLTIIALVFSLASCSSGDEKKMYDQMVAGETDEKYVASIIAKTPIYQIRFLAAARGHDITAENFQDTDEIKPANVDAAKKVLQDIINEKRFVAGSASEDVFVGYMNTLTAESIQKVINEPAFKTAPTTKSNASFPGILLVWIGKFLGLITDLVGGYYIVAIMVFAVLVEIIMLPMAIKQQKNTIGMAKLRPAIAKIEKKYAGRTDQVTMRKKQEEIMALQQKEGFSPFSGCLPLLVQLIIVGFILYPIIQNPLHYMLERTDAYSSALATYVTSPRAAGGLGMTLSSGNIMELLASVNGADMSGIASFGLFSNGAELLEALDWATLPKFTAFGINLGLLPSFTWPLILIPVINVIGQWASMFLNRRWNNTGYSPMGDRQDKFSIKMIDVLPLVMTVFILFKVPAMIGIYWFFRSLVSLGKQYVMKIVMPVPKYTEEELREIEKAEKERQKAQRAAMKQQPKYRSLHYIDEDDYDELPEVKQNTPQPKKLGSQDAPEIKD